MDREQLFHQISEKRSFLCIGLDTDPEKIPAHLLGEEDPVFSFNKAIIDATHDLAVAYKPNTAFYEASGAEGWKTLKRTVGYIRSAYPDIFIIADAKRGDIGNTSGRYAQAFFRDMDVDALTIAPYMGEDSVKPFLGHPGKWVILLALTSNPGASDFQHLGTGEMALFEYVITRSMSWGNEDSMMYVVGATQVEYLDRIRSLAPDHFLLVPGVGTQGGDLRAVAEHALNDRAGILVNSSRAILYAGQGESFADDARSVASALQKTMEGLLAAKGLL